MRGPIVTLDAHSPEAQAIQALFTQTLVICGVIGLVVAGLVGYCVYRFRERPGDVMPAQIDGNTRLEVGWTILPFLIVVGLVALTVKAVSASDPPAAGRKPDLVVVGHQWWWEIKYASGAITANEIHIPVGKKLLVQIEAADVIHDFWVPQLARKIDAVPGHPVTIWMQADAPGEYQGACAEYCGAQHAWMRIVVIADSPTDFEAWERKERAPAPAPVSEAEVRGARIYADKTCVKCHAIGGLGEQSRVAPDLTHLAARRTLGAGVLTNTKENLALWLEKPQEVKPQSHMPDLKLTKGEVADLVAYFESLK